MSQEGAVPQSRWIEVGATHALLAPTFTGDRFVAVVENDATRDQLLQSAQSHGQQIAVGSLRRGVRHNNATDLILHPRAAHLTAYWRNIRHAQTVTLAASPHAGFVLGIITCLWFALIGRLAWPQKVTVHDTAGSPRTLFRFLVRRQKPASGARHYIPHYLGVAGFLQQLYQTQARHTALRWFDNLPQLPTGEDLDLLVGDDDLTRVQQLLDSGPGLIPCDLYSETGLPRSDYRSLPYFPSYLAAELLDAAVEHRSGCRVPSPRHHFLSMAYHAIYHKGPSSGVPVSGTQTPTTNGASEHDYVAVLGKLAVQCGISCEICRTGLLAELERQGWKPPRDMVARLGKWNAWIRELFPASKLPARDEQGLAVFLVREQSLARASLSQLTAMVEELGLSIIATREFAPHDVRKIAGSIRGGNWGRGPWPVSGGPPVAAIVAVDAQPLAPTKRQRRKFPLVTNARLLGKSRIRDLLNANYPADQHMNGMHSSDNSAEAWDYIAIAMPDAADEIASKLAEVHQKFHARTSAIKDLTRFGNRAKVECVLIDGRPAVKKTFKPGKERYCQRERIAMQQLSQRIQAIPPLIAGDEHSVTYPFYDDVKNYQRSSGKLMPLWMAREAVLALKAVYEAGYALIDASIDNVLVDRQEGIKLIDFEFLYRYPTKPATFAQSYDIAGCPKDFDGDIPAGGTKTYRKHWQPYTGLSLNSLLNDPVWLQHVKRTLYVTLHGWRYYPRRLRQVWRSARQAWHARQQPQSASANSVAAPSGLPPQVETQISTDKRRAA
jgi:hypothetical protein